jgi:phage gpG-like protein
MAEFGKYADDVADKVANDPLDEAIEEAYAAVLQNIRDNFTSSATPGGDPWPERKIAGDGHPLLMDTGDLIQAATGGGSGHVVKLEPRSLLAGVDVEAIPYAATHQFGDSTRNIPSREYLGAGEETLIDIGEAIADNGLDFF